MHWPVFRSSNLKKKLYSIFELSVAAVFIFALINPVLPEQFVISAIGLSMATAFVIRLYSVLFIRDDPMHLARARIDEAKVRVTEIEAAKEWKNMHNKASDFLLQTYCELVRKREINRSQESDNFIIETATKLKRKAKEADAYLPCKR